MSRSSSASSTCRIDWRPSAWLAAALVALGLGAAVALAMSALPAWLAVAGGLAALAEAIRLARREWRRPALCLVFDATGAWWQPAAGGPVRLARVELRRRGPLTTFSARSPDGPVRLAWWPDTLSPGDRRRLVLAVASSRRHRDKPLPAMAA